MRSTACDFSSWCCLRLLGSRPSGLAVAERDPSRGRPARHRAGGHALRRPPGRCPGDRLLPAGHHDGHPQEGRRQQRQGQDQDRGRLLRSVCTTCGSGRRPGSASCARSASGRSRRSTEVEPNNDFAAPQAIPMNVTVNGVADNEDVDYLRGRGQEGGADLGRGRGPAAGDHASSIPTWRSSNAKRFELGVSDDAALVVARRVHRRSSPPRTASTSSRCARVPTRATARASTVCTSGISRVPRR